MNLRNHVQLIGNLGNTPSATVMQNGSIMTRFSVATTEYQKEGEEFKSKTYWHNIVAWGKTAETICKRCEKGSEVLINGKLINRTYEDKNGSKKYVSEVVVNEVICRPKNMG